MGLYLAVFEGDDDAELDGIDVGGYDDFDAFRSAIQENLEPAGWGSRFPILMAHNDATGVWSPQEMHGLSEELRVIQEEFRRLPPVDFPGGWQADVASTLDRQPSNLHESFFDVDGQPLLDRLIDLVSIAQGHGRPISFQ